MAALCPPPHRLIRRVRVVDVGSEDIPRIPRVPLAVEPVAGIFDERQRVLGNERRVIEPAVSLIGPVEHRQRAGAGAWVSLRELHDRAPAARRGVLRTGGIGVARLVEEEVAEAVARLELAVLWPLERRGSRSLRAEVAVEGRAA